jgi:hypothetical protein
MSCSMFILCEQALNADGCFLHFSVRLPLSPSDTDIFWKYLNNSLSSPDEYILWHSNLRHIIYFSLSLSLSVTLQFLEFQPPAVFGFLNPVSDRYESILLAVFQPTIPFPLAVEDGNCRTAIISGELPNRFYFSTVVMEEESLMRRYKYLHGVMHRKTTVLIVSAVRS